MNELPVKKPVPAIFDLMVLAAPRGSERNIPVIRTSARFVVTPSFFPPLGYHLLGCGFTHSSL